MNIRGGRFLEAVELISDVGEPESICSQNGHVQVRHDVAHPRKKEARRVLCANPLVS